MRSISDVPRPAGRKRTIEVPQSQLAITFDPQARVEEIRKLIHAQLEVSVLATFYKMMENEKLSLCGERFSRKGDEKLYSGGSALGSVFLQGQHVPVKRERMRNKKEEVMLKSYEAFRDRDVITDEVMRMLMNGVSTRDYSHAIQKISENSGLSHGSVSEAFKMASQKDLDEINGRSLEGYKFAAMMFDGIEYAGSMVVVGVGIPQNGPKVMLGLIEGASENAQVCKDLMSNLTSRGLKIEGKTLVVIDGSKALKKAVKNTWAEKAVIVRCRIHKMRNILEYLTKPYHAEARRRLNAAWAMNDYESAKEGMLKTLKWLEGISQSAANSLEEGLEETLTLHRLGVPEILRKSLATTNIIESVFSIIRARTSRVKNWRKGKNQICRWAAAGLMLAQKRMRQIRGYKYLPLLIEKLNKIEIVKEVA